LVMTSSLHDDFARTPVANFNLRPWWYLLTIELGVLISIPVFVIGGQLGLSLTLPDLILATAIGGIILGVIGGLTARLGATTRCSTALLARATFGSSGAACICLLLALGMTGWWAVQTEMFADAVIKLSQTLFHINIQREIMVIVGGCAMITTAALGIRAIGRLAYLAVPLLVSGLCYGVLSMLAAHGWQRVITYQPTVLTSIGLGPAIATVVGGWIVGASMNPDYARFARNTKHAIGYSVAHYSFNYPLVLTICGIMAIGFQTKDLLVHLVPPNLTWLVLVLIMLATWAANDCNLYSSSLGLTMVIPRLRRSSLAIAAGIIGIVFAEFRLAEHVVSFLILLSILIAPISGVFIVSGIDPRDPLDSTQLAAVPQWRFGQLLAWLSGAVLGYMTTPKDALGLGLLKITTVPTLDAVLGAAAIMLLIKLTQRKLSMQIPDVVPEALVTTNRPYAGVLDDTK
jgi:cytosine permease